jgi:outer membrane receptor protein involved in Fe transport
VKRAWLRRLAAWAVLFTAPALWAAETGKIAGKVVDVASGDPIPSVNVALMGTTMGATTDAGGEYFILNIPVGVYNVRVTSLGYETQNITGVQVLADQTTELNARLKETVLQGQEVTVVAERDVVKRDVSATVRSVSSTEISELPVTTYQDALGRTAGVVESGPGVLHIRGGRPDEILYLIDGLEVKDPQFAARSLAVSQDAIGEMEVLTAGFNAEYGEAQSAVVNLVIKEGDPQYHGRLEHVMDFQGVEHYQDYDYTEGTLSGPEPITMKLLPRLGLRIPGSMSFFGSGTGLSRNTTFNGVWIDTDRWYRHQMTDLFGLDVRKNRNNVSSNAKLTYAPSGKYKFSLGWNQAEAWTNPYVFRVSRRFPWDFSPEDISKGVHGLADIQGLETNAKDYPNLFWDDVNHNGKWDQGEPGIDDDHDGRVNEEALNWRDDDGDGLIDEDLQLYEYNANDHTQVNFVRDQQMLLSFNHNVSQRTFYTVRLGLYDAYRTLSGGNKAANEYGLASEPFVDLPDSLGHYNHYYDAGEPFTDLDGDGMWDYNNPDNQYAAINGFAISADGLAGNIGQLVPSWRKFESQTYTLKTDLSSQLTTRHLLKSGVEFNYYNTAAESRGYPTVNNQGFGSYTEIYRYYPVSGALYLQDKMEYKDIIVNAGVRGDYWRTYSGLLKNPKAREPGGSRYADYEPPPKDGEAYVSPRLGIAYSVTEKDVFHFNYGYFYQRGRQDYYYTSVNQLLTGGTSIIGNPDLEPMKTIAYELGVRHQFGADFLLDVSTYYKDIKNWINTASQNQLFYDLYGITVVGSNNAIYYNADYASVRGFELNLSKDYGSRFAGRVTYTLAWATGKNSYDSWSDVTRGNYVEPRRETPLAWDRRHQIVLNLAYHDPVRGKPFTTKWLLSGWEGNVISQALSGLPYTPTYANGTDVFGQEFSRRTPWTYSTDLNLSRAFAYGKLNLRLLVEIRNLFNAINILDWDVNADATGDNGSFDSYVGANGRPGYVNDNASPNYWGPLDAPRGPADPSAWNARRLIRAGLSVEF